MLVLIGELLSERPKDDFKPQIEGEFGSVATENQAVGGFMQQRASGVDKQLPREEG